MMMVIVKKNKMMILVLLRIDSNDGMDVSLFESKIIKLFLMDQFWLN